jgi:hypothetical protein
VKRALIALLVVGSAACALLVARAGPTPDLTCRQLGDGFALAGSIGLHHLGLKRLECTPGACSFVQIEHH